MAEEQMLFPKYLNQGSVGPAVSALQVFLRARGYNPRIIVDSEYKEETAQGVKEYQTELAEKGYGIEVDGNFGPATRAATRDYLGINFNTIPLAVFQCETAAVGP